MTLTTKDSADPASPSKPAAPASNPENRSAHTPRSNPVCLELSVTIRSLPTESGGAFQPIREEGRTVIVFDNGAVLRCTSNLPVGQTVILSNPSGRDVICRIVGARNMPSIKGYVEVEFLEAVEDFWHIHQPIEPAAVASQSQVTLQPSSPASVGSTPPAAAGREIPARTAPDKPTDAPIGSGPSFEDVAGLVSPPNRTTSRELRVEPAKPAPELLGKTEPVRTPAENNGSAVSSGKKFVGSEPRSEDPEDQEQEDANSLLSRDFSQGLLSSTQASSSPSNGPGGGMPLRIAGAALLLVCIGGGMLLMQRHSAPVSSAHVNAPMQPSVPEPSTSGANKEPELGSAAQPPAKGALQVVQTQSAVVAHAEPAASIAPTPAAATSRAAKNSLSDPLPEKSAQDKSANASKTPEVASANSEAIPNLKMKSPSAPKRSLGGQIDSAAPAAEIAPPESAGAISAPGLLSTVAHPPSQPAPPPLAPAEVATKNRDAKLVSSAAAVYPQAAKIANIQGSVSVLVSIDANGNVVDAKAESGPMLLRQAALESVRRWRYSPALIDGKPAATKTVVSVEFKLR